MTRSRRGARFDDISPDPSRVGGVAEVPFVRLPDPATLFAGRARRLTALAHDHTLSAYLDFLAAVATAQADCVASLAPPAPVPAEQVAQRSAHGFPPISAVEVRGNRDFSAALTGLLDRLTLDGAPAAARAAAAAVRVMDVAAQFDLAADILAGAIRADLVAESLFVVAALQVHLAGLAAQLDAKSVAPAAEAICPVCGGAPVSSLVVGWTQASKARYCACGLCGSLWNHVRIKCTSCGATGGIVYYTIEDGDKTIGVETCASCRSYIKHMQQHENPALDPIADDIGSYALDLLAQAENFSRATPNPLLIVVS